MLPSLWKVLLYSLLVPQNSGNYPLARCKGGVNSWAFELRKAFSNHPKYQILLLNRMSAITGFDIVWNIEDPGQL